MLKDILVNRLLDVTDILSHYGHVLHAIVECTLHIANLVGNHKDVRRAEVVQVLGLLDGVTAGLVESIPVSLELVFQGFLNAVQGWARFS